MNTVLLNTVHLDGAPIIKKVSGEGGGSTILNQSKSVDITENGSVSVTPDVGYTGLSKVDVNVDVPTQEINNQDKAIDIVENGTTEVVADSGYTGLGKVSVNVNVASSGGSVEPPKDGKTRLFITVDQEEKKQVQIVFQQNIANGINIDWGDGSPSETSNEKLNFDIVMVHEYVTIGEYVITIDVAPSCNAGIGYQSSSSNAFTGNVSISRKLHKVIIGNGININKSAFDSCYALKNVEILNEDIIIIGEGSFGCCYSLGNITLPNTMSANIEDKAFNACCSLVNISIPNGIVTITNGLFQNCRSLESVTFPPTIENIEANAFQRCINLKTLDFSRLLSVPILSQLVFTDASSDFKVIVPDALYDEWIAATNWSGYASKIIKKSDWDASQA